MIHLINFEPYSLRDLEASMDGVQKEIDRRNNSLRQMRFYQKHPGKAHGQYSEGFIEKARPKLATEIATLTIIKIELIYLYELSKLKLRG